MAIDYANWDKAISERLSGLRQEITSIPVRAIPKSAGKLSQQQVEAIDWLFPSFQRISENNEARIGKKPYTIGSTSMGKAAPVFALQFTLLVRLSFQDRYSDEAENKKALEWSIVRLLHLLSGFNLPGTQTPLVPESGNLTPPEAGIWGKDLIFTFQTTLDTSEENQEVVPLIKLIESKKDNNLLTKVES